VAGEGRERGYTRMLQIPPKNREKKPNRESAYVLHDVHGIRCRNVNVVWCVVVEWKESKGLGDGAGVKRTLDVEYPLRPQGRILSFE